MSIAIVNKSSNEEKMKKEKNNWEKQKENHEKINERKQGGWNHHRNLSKEQNENKIKYGQSRYRSLRVKRENV